VNGQTALVTGGERGIGRGIVARGPYALIRHPAYVCKNMAWWIGSLPLVGVAFAQSWLDGVLAVASVTDRVDGQLARSRGLVTDFGKIADPIADKALIGAALVGLSSLGELAWWVTVVVLVREIGVTLLRFWVIRHGVMPASRGGKVKTLVQAVAIGLLVLPLDGWLHEAALVVMYVAVAVTVVTGVDYVARALRLRRTSARAAMKRARRKQQ